MIYDVTMFYNEIDLLELRLKMNYQFIDKFIIVESEKTFMGQAKPLILNNFRDRLEPYFDKIIYIPVNYSGEKFTKSNGFYQKFKSQYYWLNEHYQRDAAIIEPDIILNDNDIIICSDLDEIYNFQSIKQQFIDIEFAKLSMFMSYYYFNARLGCDWEYPFLITGRLLKEHNCRLSYFRNYYHNMPKIFAAGWHFSNLGDIGYIMNKCNTNAHSPECSNITEKTIQEAIEKVHDIAGRYPMYIEKDLSYLPQEITDNLSKYKRFIK